MVVGAHAADFVWRSAGVIALVTRSGGRALSVALSYGARGESGELWSEPGQTLDRVVRVRNKEASAAAKILGAEFQCLDLGDYPLDVDARALALLADLMRGFEPDLVITHTVEDRFNPDHPVAHAAAIRAQQLATGAGRAAAFKTIRQPVVVMFEPHYPDSSGFEPDIYVDITTVSKVKDAAMAAVASQKYMPEYQLMRSRQRAWQARRISGTDRILHAEVFQRFTPQVVDTL
jgi:4-oxalomesaconate hydratase